MTSEIELLDEDLVVWMDANLEMQFAVRRDFGWPSGQWQVCKHKFSRINDGEVRQMLEDGTCSYYRPDGNGQLQLLALSWSTQGQTA